MVFRLTHKLLKAIKAAPSPELEEGENPFVDWAADHFTFRGRRIILVTNCASILTWVYPGRGVNDSDSFIKCSLEAIRICLRENGFQVHWEKIISPSSSEVTFRKVGDRNLTGIMMELVKHAKFYLSDCYDEMTLEEVSKRLSEMPQLSRKEAFPLEAFRSLELPKR